MTDRFDFPIHVLRLRRLVVRRRLERAGAVALITGGTLLAVLSVLSRWGMLRVSQPGFALLAACGALLLAFMWDRYRPITPARALMELDRRLGLQDLLATAFETHRTGRVSVFTTALYRQAGHTMGPLKPGQLIPLRPSRPAIAAAFLCAVCLLLFFLTAPGAGPSSGPAATQAKAAADHILARIQDDRFTAQVPHGEQARQTQERMIEQLERAARDFNRQAMSSEQFLRLLDDLVNRLESMGDRLQNQLTDELWMGGESEEPDQGPSRIDGWQLDQMDQLQEQLAEPFGGRLPPSLAQRLKELKQIRQLAQLVDEALESAGLHAAGPKTDSDGTHAAALEMEPAGSGDPAGGEPLPEDGRPAQPSAEGQAGSLGAEQAQERPAPGDTGPGDEGPASAGRAQGGRESQPAADLSGIDGPAVQDQGLRSAGPRYNRYVLALPLADREGRPPEETLRSYERQVESVLLKEDIPEAYREFIKTYFLSIDLNRGEPDHGDPQHGKE